MPLVVGHVLSCEAVAGKANLRECSIDIGEAEPITVVTNCSNVRKDTHTVVATIGTDIEVAGESIKIAKTNVGGVYSSGMLCDSPMCGWVGGAAGLCVQVPLNLAVGSPAPTSKPRLDGSSAGASAEKEPEVSAKDLKAKEKADRKALAAAKKAARKAKGNDDKDNKDEEEDDKDDKEESVVGAAEALGKATLDA